MKYAFLCVGLALSLGGCTLSEAQVENTLKKNPKILFSVIEEHAEEFMASVRRAAESDDRAQQGRRVAAMQAEQEKDIGHPKQPKLTVDRRLKGKEGGKLVVVAYGDFQCPACGVGHGPLNQFLEKHADDVEFYFKNMPLDFHKMAYPAALYFEALRLQDRKKAAAFYDDVFAHQREMTEESFLDAAAMRAGADMKRLTKDMKSDAVKKTIAADQKEFADFGFTGTPVVLINGVALQGAQPLAELERIAARTRK